MHSTTHFNDSRYLGKRRHAAAVAQRHATMPLWKARTRSRSWWSQNFINTSLASRPHDFQKQYRVFTPYNSTTP
jgi:hypothetical protein